MKWIFILLLLTNVVYLGWEIDRNSHLDRANLSSAIKVPAGTPRLALLSELDKVPDERNLIQLDEEISAEAFNSEPVMPIALNPNTEKMMSTLLADSSMMPLDEGFQSDKIITKSEFPSGSNASSENTVCYTYGPIPDAKESKLFLDWLNERDIAHHQRQTNEQGKQRFWVYLAPQESRALAEATLEDLKQKGVRDLLLVREGDLLNAISLGLFSSQAAVNRRLNEIKAKGYKSVVVPQSGEKQLHWFDVSIVQNSSYVNDLFTGFPARFNALPVDCNEIAMHQGNP